MPPRANLEFQESKEFPGVALKFGGEPFGLPQALWPKSRSTGDAMQFICQIPLDQGLFPQAKSGVAFLFLTPPELETDTWRPDSGENAVIIVPMSELTGAFATGDAPRLTRMVKKWWSKLLQPEVCIFAANAIPASDPELLDDAAFSKMTPTDREAYISRLEGNKLGGTPRFIQSAEFPEGGPWQLLLQLDSATTPFWINFGDAGIGYAFINPTATEGKFLWQCC